MYTSLFEIQVATAINTFCCNVVEGSKRLKELVDDMKFDYWYLKKPEPHEGQWHFFARTLQGDGLYVLWHPKAGLEVFLLTMHGAKQLYRIDRQRFLICMIENDYGSNLAIWLRWSSVFVRQTSNVTIIESGIVSMLVEYLTKFHPRAKPGQLIGPCQFENETAPVDHKSRLCVIL